jgi:hypothetical protein
LSGFVDGGMGMRAVADARSLAAPAFCALEAHTALPSCFPPIPPRRAPSDSLSTSPPQCACPSSPLPPRAPASPARSGGSGCRSEGRSTWTTSRCCTATWCDSLFLSLLLSLSVRSFFPSLSLLPSHSISLLPSLSLSLPLSFTHTHTQSVGPPRCARDRRAPLHRRPAGRSLARGGWSGTAARLPHGACVWQGMCKGGRPVRGRGSRYVLGRAAHR